jgi:hypothetical protein
MGPESDFTRGPDKAQMHLNWGFSTRQVLWTLTFSAQLVLLVVLLGRDRMRRYPWFTAAGVLFALRLMAEMLLAGRMAMLPFQEILLTLGDLAVVLGLLVVVEMARRAFAGAPRPMWMVNAAGLLVVASGVLAVWGPWPVWKDMALGSVLGKLRLMQLAAQKGDTMVALLTVGLGLLVVIFGRRFKAGWRSHTQMIVIGLLTAAISLLATQGAVQAIAKSAHPHSRAEYEQILRLLSNLVNAHQVVYLAAQLWWIVWLWLDEPGVVATVPAPEDTAEISVEGEQ